MGLSIICIIVLAVLCAFILGRAGRNRSGKESSRECRSGMALSSDNPRGRIVMVTYADDRFARKRSRYTQTQNQVVEVMSRHPDIKRVLRLTPSELFQTSLYRQYTKYYEKGFFAGAGYSFKPFFIREALRTVDDGEYVLYHDCSPEIWNFDLNYTSVSLQPIMEACTRNSGIITPDWDNPKHVHRRMTQPTCMQLMRLEHLADKKQGSASWILTQKSLYAETIIDEWLKYTLNQDCAATHDEATIRKSVKDFVQNRHDQSVISLILLREGLSTMPVCRGGRSTKKMFSAR